MKARKNIDRLYRERLNNVSTTPREDLWKNIANRLPEKKQKKNLVPYWFKIAGVAAIIALMVGVGKDILKPEAAWKSSSSGYIYNSTRTGEITRPPTVSSYFQQQMNSSVHLLESLIATTENEIQKQKKEENNQLFIPKKLSPSPTIRFSDLINVPENIIVNHFNFSDYNIAALDDEERQREKALLENELQDLVLPSGKEKEINKGRAAISTTSNRLSLRPTAGAVYFDNLGSGNIINSQFNSHESKGEVSFAYGINLAYQLSDKFKIRSGINKVVFSHNTFEIDYSTAVSALAGTSIQAFQGAEGERDRNLSIVSYRTPGDLNQQMNFIEVPLEIEYALINKQIGLNVIAGASTLFLNGDMVSINSAEISGQIGETNNLNDISFSANIGIGIDYNISPRFQLNLEPIFKYQLNTFHTSSGIQPYNLGIYSGFRFKF